MPGLADALGLCRNMGPWDRLLRGVLASSILGVSLATNYLDSDLILSVLAYGFAALNVFAVISGICPMYFLTGTDTRGPAARG